MQRLLVMMVCAALVLTGCSSAREALVPAVESGKLPAKGDASATVPASLPEANTAFGFRLLRRMDASAGEGNTLLSPFSVTSALAMTANGGDAKTRAMMEDVLFGGGLSLASADASYADLLARLGSDTPSSKLAIANSLWLSERVRFSPSFLKTTRDYYSSETTTVAFGTAEANERINGWVDARTRGLIPQLLDPTPLPKETLMVLVNALYFKADWAQAFDPFRTRDDTFTAAAGPIRVPMMSADTTVGYLATPRFQAGRLPYKDGKRALYLFVPRYTEAEKMSGNPNMGSPLDEFLKELDASQWGEWMRGFSSTPDVFVALPKMKLKTRVHLTKPLTALGMGAAFEGGFEPMLETKPDGRVSVSDVIHAVTVEVDEKGTKAAAATAVEMVGATSIAEVDPPQVIADRPFFFAIRDEASGVVLFAGAVRDPRQ